MHRTLNRTVKQHLVNVPPNTWDESCLLDKNVRLKAVQQMHSPRPSRFCKQKRVKRCFAKDVLKVQHPKKHHLKNTPGGICWFVFKWGVNDLLKINRYDFIPLQQLNQTREAFFSEKTMEDQYDNSEKNPFNRTKRMLLNIFVAFMNQCTTLKNKQGTLQIQRPEWVLQKLCVIQKVSHA